MRNWKNLAPLAVIFAILAALVVLKQVQDRPVAIEDHLRERMTALVPETVSTGAVTKLELYAGGAPEDRVVLERDAEDPNVWRVASHYNAPANLEKIEEFVTKLSELRGELRARDVTGDDLSEFELADGEAFHVLAYTGETDAPAAHVLSGRAPRSGQVFVRTVDDSTVYVGDVNFRREAQIWSDDIAQAPQPAPWTDTEIVQVERDDVVRLALTMPDKELVFEKREKPSEDAEDEGEALVPPAEPEYEWVLAQGGMPGQDFKRTGLDSALNVLNPLNASEIVDPDTLEEWGLAEPGFKCVVTLDGGANEIVIEGGRPESGPDGYVRLADAADPVVYKLSSYNFGRLFPKGSDLFDLQSLSLDRDSVTRIEMDLPEAEVVLVKEEDAWTVAQPAADLDVDTTAITTLAGALAGWKASDYTDAAPLGEPVRRVSFTMDDGESHVLEIGGPSKAIEGNYARLDGGDVVAMSRGDVAKVLVEPRNLYRRALLAAHAVEIEAITITPETGPAIALARDEDGAWLLDGAEADADAAESLAEVIAGLQAEDILFEKTASDFEPQTSITVTFEDGTVQTLMLGAETEDGTELMMEGKASVFLITRNDANALTPSRETLEIEEPEPDTEDPDESAVARDAAAAPADEDEDEDAAAPQDAEQDEEGA